MCQHQSSLYKRPRLGQFNKHIAVYEYQFGNKILISAVFSSKVNRCIYMSNSLHTPDVHASPPNILHALAEDDGTFCLVTCTTFQMRFFPHSISFLKIPQYKTDSWLAGKTLPNC